MQHSGRTIHRIFTLLSSMLWLAVLASCADFPTTPNSVVMNSAAVVAAPQFWVEVSLKRVGQHDAPGANKIATVAAARGEFESFQVVVRAPTGGLSNVQFGVSALRGPNGSSIGGQNIQLYREHYVNVAQSSPDLGGTNKPLGAGVYADGLIPAADPLTGAAPKPAALRAFPFTLAAGMNQPIWVDVFVPYGSAPGAYSGSFTLTSDQGSASGTIALTVWDFDLPRRPALQSSFGIWVDSASQATAQELLHNKIMPRDAVDARLQASGTAELTSVNLGFWSGANVTNCSMDAPPSVSAIRQAAAAFPPNLLVYNYTADEIGDCTQLYGPLRQWAQNLHRAGVPNLVTIAPTSQLFDDGLGSGRSVVDIWTMLPKMYEAAGANVERARQKGDALWSYNSLVQDGYSPKWQIDFSPLDFRIQPGFLSQSLGLKGLLYWRVDLWTSDPWNNLRTFNNGERWFYGDGMLVYPGAQVGVASSVASMRLKWLRDGVEDYDYVQILKRLGHGSQALTASHQAAVSWHTWTREPAVITRVRQQLAAQILQAMQSKVYLPTAGRAR